MTKKRDVVLEKIADSFNIPYGEVDKDFKELLKTKKERDIAIAATYGKYRNKQVAGQKLDSAKAICLNIGAPFIKRIVRDNFDCEHLDPGTPHPDVRRGATWIRTFEFLVDAGKGKMDTVTAMRFDADTIDDDVPLLHELVIKGNVRGNMLMGFEVVDVGDAVDIEDLEKHIDVIKVYEIEEFIKKVGINNMQRTNEKVLITGYALSPVPGDGNVSDRVELMSPEDPKAPTLTVWTDLKYNVGLTEYTEVAIYGDIRMTEDEKYGKQYTMNTERLIFEADESLVDTLKDVEVPDEIEAEELKLESE